MNRIHRIVWSECRKSFIVAGENAKAKGKPCSSTRTAVASAVLMALAALAAEPAIAASSCPGASISISGAETSTCNLANGNALTVTSSGSINATPTAVLIGNAVSSGSVTNNGTIASAGFGVNLDTTSFTGDITNNASGIFSTGSNSINVTKSSIAGSITNLAGGTITSQNQAVIFHGSTMSGNFINGGTVYGLGRGFELNAVTGLPATGSTVGSIVNTGTIQGGSSGINIATNSTVTGGITNSGTISGVSWSGIYVAGYPGAYPGGYLGGSTNLAIHSTISGGIVNNGTISGGSGGIVLSWASVLSGGINNTGTISGGSSAGIYVGRHSTFSGGITNSGTITGGAPGAIRVRIYTTLGGGITNSGTIQANSGGAGISVTQNAVIGMVTNSGTISGNTHAINVDGTSTLSNIDITGTTARFIGDVFAQTADVAVKAGATFTNDNAFDVKSFTVENGATFNMGAGPNLGVANAGITVTNGFTNAGTLAIAAGTSATIVGNYNQSSAGVFKTGVANDTTYGKLVVTGTATLPTSAMINVNVATPNFAFTAANMAGIITAGTLTSDGTFNVTDNSLLFNFTATKNGNSVDLNLAGAAAGGVVNAVTVNNTTTGSGIASVLDSLVATFAGGTTGNADMDVVIAQIGGMTTTTQVSDAVTQTEPLLTGGMSNATSNTMNGVNKVVQAHMEQETGLSSGDNFITDRYVWIKPLGSLAKQNDRNGVSGYKAKTSGVVFGADSAISDTTRIGAGLAVTHSSVNNNLGVQSAGISGYQAVLYGSHSLDGKHTELNWQADYGINQNNSNRNINFMARTASANYTGYSYHVGGGIGRTLDINDKTSFTPSVRADYTSIHSNAYNETGAGALNLAVNAQTTDQLIVAVDGKAAHKLSDATTLMANLGIGYNTLSKQSSITAAFQGGGAAFTTYGINPSPTMLQCGLGMVMKSSKLLEVTARYDFETRSGFTDQTVSVKARWPF